jgi:6-pyruvoyltetrahydropterin/6-carboxytetrahydropterin synthase
MYEVAIKKTFSAAHTLSIGGKCEELHGHNFTVEITAESAELNENGLVVDFRTLKKWADEILERLDHKFLNDIDIFSGINPSSENIARLIYDEMARRADDADNLRISKVSVWESENSRASYSR